jgi:hypothetical protein
MCTWRISLSIWNTCVDNILESFLIITKTHILKQESTALRIYRQTDIWHVIYRAVYFTLHVHPCPPPVVTTPYSVVLYSTALEPWRLATANRTVPNRRRLFIMLLHSFRPRYPIPPPTPSPRAFTRKASEATSKGAGEDHTGHKGWSC